MTSSLSLSPTFSLSLPPTKWYFQLDLRGTKNLMTLLGTILEKQYLLGIQCASSYSPLGPTGKAASHSSVVYRLVNKMYSRKDQVESTEVGCPSSHLPFYIVQLVSF